MLRFLKFSRESNGLGRTEVRPGAFSIGSYLVPESLWMRVGATHLDKSDSWLELRSLDSEFSGARPRCPLRDFFM